MFDGTDIKTLNPAYLRGRVSMVPQKALLFSGTIRDNIRFGRPDADGETVYKAAQISQSLESVSYTHLVPKGGVHP